MVVSTSSFAAGGGKVITDLGGIETAFSVVLQSNGKILVTGYSYDLSDNAYLAMARYNADGSLDSTFSGDGITLMNSGMFSAGFSLKMQSDGKILVAGAIDDGNAGGDFLLARYNSDGSLDTTFASNGIATSDFGDLDIGFSVTTQSNGKILVGGTSGQYFALARYNVNGSLDTSFSSDGKVVTDFGSAAAGSSVAVQSDGKILVSGLAVAGNNMAFAIARYNVDGSLDTGFSGDGKVITDFGSSSASCSMTLQADGKILVAGGGYLSGLTFNGFALARYNVDGSLDTSFSGDGIVLTDFGQDAAGQSIQVQTDGKIVVGGFENGDFAIVRYNADGSLDTTFSADGKVTNDLGKFECINDLVIQADGKIVAAGATGDDKLASEGNIAIVRYNADGSLDSGGIVTPDTTPPTVVTFNPLDGGTGVAVNANIILTFSEAVQRGAGTIAIYTGSSSGAVVESFNAATSSHLSISGNTLTIDPTADLSNGTHYYVTFDVGSVKDLAGNTYSGNTAYDFTTGVHVVAGSGMTLTDIGGADYAFSSTLQSDGKILVTGVSDGQIALVRYNADGTLDTGFSDNGQFVSGYSGYSFGLDVASQDNGSIFTSGTSDGDFILNKYYADGTPDTGFGVVGKAVTSIDADDTGASLYLLPDGHILASGTILDSEGNGDFGLIRYNADGSLDTSFSDDGIVRTHLLYDEETGFIIPQPDGKILLSGCIWYGDGTSDGGGNADFVLLRYLADGTLDNDFGVGGYVVTDFRTADEPGRATLQTDGKIVVAGHSEDDIALARYNSDGSLDTSFSEDGKVVTDFGAVESAWAVKVLNEGKILVAGSSYTGEERLFRFGDSGFQMATTGNSDFLLVRYNVNGSLDTSFGNGGRVTTDLAGIDMAMNLLVQDDGKIILTGTSNGDFVVVRYNSDGSIDSSFGGSSDTTLPAVVTFSPGDGATMVAVSTNISITFSEAVQRGAGTIAIHTGSSSGAVVESFDAATSSRLSISGNTLTIDPSSDLSNNTQYYVTISNGSIKDLTGNSYAGTSSYDFTTIHAIDSTRPTGSTITAYDIDHNGQYSGGDRLIFSFSEPVSIASMHSLTADQLGIPPGKNFSAVSHGIPLDPVSGFASKYLIYFDTAVNIRPGDSMTIPKFYVQDVVGNEAASDVTFTLPTLSSTLPTATITGSIAAFDTDNNHAYNQGDSFVVTFSEPINVDLIMSYPAGDTTLLPAGEVSDSDGYAINEVNGYASQFVVYVAAGDNLHAGDTATIPKGNVIDTSGLFASSDVVLYFPSLVFDNTPPTVTSFSPGDDEIRVPVERNIVITFSEPIQMGDGTITLKTAAGSIVESYTLGSSHLSILGNVMTINPAYDLANSTAYSLEIGGNAVMDLAGHPYVGTTSYNFTAIGLTSAEAILERAYIAYFGRPAEPNGFNWWLSAISSLGGIDAVMTEVYQDFSSSDEYLNQYASDLDPVTHAVTNAQHLLNAIYQNLFHRDIEQGGLEFWGDLLIHEEVTINSVVLEVLNGARNLDFDAVNCKIDAALALTNKIEEINPSGYDGVAATHVAHDWLSDIYDASTLESALVDQYLTSVSQHIIDVTNGIQQQSVSLIGVI
jgi:uncharacterized delta-60 repeat protein